MIASSLAFGIDVHSLNDSFFPLVREYINHKLFSDWRSYIILCLKWKLFDILIVKCQGRENFPENILILIKWNLIEYASREGYEVEAKPLKENITLRVIVLRADIIFCLKHLTKCFFEQRYKYLIDIKPQRNLQKPFLSLSYLLSSVIVAQHKVPLLYMLKQ